MKQLQDTLNNAYEYFNSKRAVFETLAKQENNILKIIDFQNSFKFKKAIFIIGLILFWILTVDLYDDIAIFIGFAGFMQGHLDSLMNSDFNFIRLILVLLLVALAYLPLFIIYTVIFNFGIKLYKKLKVALSQKSLGKYGGIYNECVEELKNHYMNYEVLNGEKSPIPFNRSHPELIMQIINIVNFGRADSVKEAINVIIQDEHNQYMQDMQKQQLMQLNGINRTLNKIESNTSWIAWNTF